MKTKEARQLWCPFVRYESDRDDLNYNRRGANSCVPDECLCVADLCMAWRWHEKEDYVHGIKVFTGGTPDSGYCGLAGDRGTIE